MNDTASIEAKLVGSAEAKKRRAALLAELSHAFAERGAQAVTDEATGRIAELADTFTKKLQELRKQL